jgi:F-type H+-transporting ATPase subunit b
MLAGLALAGPVLAAAEGAAEQSPLPSGWADVDVQMMVWTWVVFLLLAGILYKFGINPILAALDQRETTIRTGLEAADKANQELASIAASREKLLREAEEQAKQIVEDSRRAAREAARIIEEKAKQDAQIVLENAHREIRTAEEKARANLRRECGDLAIKLATRLVNENLDDARHRALVNTMLSEI